MKLSVSPPVWLGIIAAYLGLNAVLPFETLKPAPGVVPHAHGASLQAPKLEEVCSLRITPPNSEIDPDFSPRAPEESIFLWEIGSDKEESPSAALLCRKGLWRMANGQVLAIGQQSQSWQTAPQRHGRFDFGNYFKEGRSFDNQRAFLIAGFGLDALQDELEAKGAPIAARGEPMEIASGVVALASDGADSCLYLPRPQLDEPAVMEGYALSAPGDCRCDSASRTCVAGGAIPVLPIEAQVVISASCEQRAYPAFPALGLYLSLPDYACRTEKISDKFRTYLTALVTEQALENPGALDELSRVAALHPAPNAVHETIRLALQSLSQVQGDLAGLELLAGALRDRTAALSCGSSSSSLPPPPSSTSSSTSSKSQSSSSSSSSSAPPPSSSSSSSSLVPPSSDGSSDDSSEGDSSSDDSESSQSSSEDDSASSDGSEPSSSQESSSSQDNSQSSEDSDSSSSSQSQSSESVSSSDSQGSSAGNSAHSLNPSSAASASKASKPSNSPLGSASSQGSVINENSRNNLKPDINPIPPTSSASSASSVSTLSSSSSSNSSSSSESSSSSSSAPNPRVEIERVGCRCGDNDDYLPYSDPPQLIQGRAVFLDVTDPIPPECKVRIRVLPTSKIQEENTVTICQGSSAAPCSFSFTPKSGLPHETVFTASVTATNCGLAQTSHLRALFFGASVAASLPSSINEETEVRFSPALGCLENLRPVAQAATAGIPVKDPPDTRPIRTCQGSPAMTWRIDNTAQQPTWILDPFARRWYGRVQDNSETDYYCYDHTAGDYEATFPIRFNQCPGLEVKIKTATTVLMTDCAASYAPIANYAAQNASDYLEQVTNPPPNQCCYRIRQGANSIITTSGIVNVGCNPVQQCFALTLAEEQEHQRQFEVYTNWAEGGVSQCLGWDRVVHHLGGLNAQYCDADCANAKLDAEAALRQAAFAAMNDWLIVLGNPPENRCWIEHTAKQAVGWNCAYHYACTYGRETPPCNGLSNPPPQPPDPCPLQP